ncbi:MAG: pullulanase-type alpha-1,6-glucosidase [Gammaproteobacteria bacterium]
MPAAPAPATGGTVQPLEDARAHWVDRGTLVLPGLQAGQAATLEIWPDASLNAGAGATRDARAIALRKDGGSLPVSLAERFPHLAGQPVLRIDAPAPDGDELRHWLRGQVAVSVVDADGQSVLRTGVQIGGVLDDLFTYEGPLGAGFGNDRVTLRLWAPTARSVDLLLFTGADPDGDYERLAMRRDEESGVWTVSGPLDWDRRFYLYEVEVYAPVTGRIERNRVTDPYALSLAADSALSQIVNLDDADLAPPGWRAFDKPPFTAPEDMVLYELHLRDFSIRDETVPAPERGTYLAFTRDESVGMRHLRRLARAGVSHLHLLPVFDIASIPERRAEQARLDTSAMAGLAPDSPVPQQRIGEIRSRDGFNWGYDPWHYTVPEGSYATDPDGVVRIVEFRRMVQALAATGLRVVMDVVYNHTHAAGQDPYSVLDRIVPGYYQRLDLDGRVETSTCCANTASERRMMEKLMIDSVLAWARHYRIDGFRFDLMGHHSLANMIRLRAALDALRPETDGVDGRQIYLYGEGWNFGEVANDARFVQARQHRLGGTGIGSFSDRLRDGARGGVHGSHPATQGFVNGLGFDPSAWTGANGPDRDTALRRTDWIRVGLAADVASYRFEAADGVTRRADEIDYNGSPAGYTEDPAENIAYVAAHDNDTLFDANQFKLPAGTAMADRVRAQTLASALVLLGQGVPFIHAGQEFLRSKSLDLDSYDSGDWFNAIDWTFETGNWGRGLPPAWRNEEHWPLMGPLLANPALAPTAEDRRRAVAEFESLLRIRGSSRLFRLRTAEEIRRHLRFHNTGPDQVQGLIVMSLSDEEGALGDPYRHVVVLFNARPEPVTFEIAGLVGHGFVPHPERKFAGQMPTSKGDFSVPAREVAVYVVPATAAQGD